MNKNISRIKTLYAYEDGDTITPRMGVQIATGHGLQQFYNPKSWQVTNTDFASFPPTLFPQPYSGKVGAVVVPASGYQWYYNNISDNAGILDADGAVKAAFADRFEVTEVTMNGKTFPALKIKANLVSPTNKDGTDKYIYFSGIYAGKQFVCEQLIPVQAVVGDAYQLLISVTGPKGTGDEVLIDDKDWIEYTAMLQMMSTGATLNDATYTFEHLENGAWATVTNQTGVTEVSGNKLKIFAPAVDGAELFRVKCVYGGKTFYKYMEPTDESDPYYIVDGCTISGDTVKRGETVAFHPKVMARRNGVGEEDQDVTASEGWTFTYTLVGQRSGEVITDINQTGITFDKLTEYGGIATRIQASKP